MTSTGRAFLTLFGLSLIVSYLLMLNELRIMLNWCVENYVTFKQRHINHIPLVIIGLWTIVRWISIHIIYDFLMPKALFINLIMRWSELAPVDTIVTDLISICVSLGENAWLVGFIAKLWIFAYIYPLVSPGGLVGDATTSFPSFSYFLQFCWKLLLTPRNVEMKTIIIINL